MTAVKKTSEVSRTKFPWAAANAAAHSTPVPLTACFSRSRRFFRIFS
jgi:hypothetical protein